VTALILSIINLQTIYQHQQEKLTFKTTSKISIVFLNSMRILQAMAKDLKNGGHPNLQI
jgi:hypothetical protein